jgi:pancreatic lipase-related protein 2
MNHASFRSDRDTVIYHYGFSQTENSDNVLEIINAYVSTDIANFVLIYYDNLTTNTVNSARSLGNALADAFGRLCDAGVPSSRLHLIGFSLGAQIQAIASRNMQGRLGRGHIVGRLTGLDPGQISAVFLPLTGRLSSSDAGYVDSIHVEAVGFGDHESQGHVAYFVNGGVSQPFCTSAINTVRQTCSHNFAPTMWAEAVRARAAVFPARHCDSWDLFVAGNCHAASPIGNVGPITSRTVRGSYFLSTNLVAPFSRPLP